ncbi:MAG: efflux RND transporter periplasmic adaptor subunit [Isosphaeraceae bacterium]|nr:efflux RND transporter periplasmic adaptor subunit [Isosphaeraceae bacterium]
MKKLLLVMALLWTGGAVALWYWNDTRTQHIDYRTVHVHRGDLQATINATGTIEPEEVVDVGAQIAGEIQSFGSDPAHPDKPINYGSHVEAGSVLARLDDSVLKARLSQSTASVTRAEADVTQAEAKLRQADRELERSKKLQARGTGIVAQAEHETALANFETAKAALEVNKAGLTVAKANLQEAEVNLSHATIRSPVKGVILDRRVNIGQTVVANLNAHSLFLIAKDLGRMEIWASVNETDIGGIHEGQEVVFTVGAMPKESFRGRVAQIRLNASMVQNVVTYTVVVSFDNSGGKLLPYLTARVQFQVEGRKATLIVPNAALRWQPRPEHVAPDAREAFLTQRQQKAHETSQAAAEPHTEGFLWVRQGDYVRPVAVSVGLSDGAQTEVLGSAVQEGMEVVVGVVRRESVDEAASILPHTQVEKKAKK